jgi:hypothetical protein
VQLTRIAYRHRRIWLLLGWGMVVSVAILSLVPISVDLGGGRDKIAHLAAYGGMTFWFGMLYAGRRGQFGIAVAFAAMGVAIEFLQGLTDYRSFELADMAANAVGAVLGWGLAQTRLQGALSWMERVIAPKTPRRSAPPPLSGGQ